jgi:hypothetical protein
MNLESKNMKDFINTRVRIPMELHQWLKQNAKENFMSKHGLIIQAIKKERDQAEKLKAA